MLLRTSLCICENGIVRLRGGGGVDVCLCVRFVSVHGYILCEMCGERVCLRAKSVARRVKMCCVAAAVRDGAAAVRLLLAHVARGVCARGLSKNTLQINLTDLVVSLCRAAVRPRPRITERHTHNETAEL